MAILFQPEHDQWGQLGDSLLPYSGIELSDWLHAQFAGLTGQPLSADNLIGVARIPCGGMSGGLVTPQFWHDRVLPLLLQRLAGQS